MKKILIMLMSMILVCGCTFAEDAVTSATLKIDTLPVVKAEDNGILVVYFSPDDTTKAAAYAIAAELKAELFEIVAEEPYTADDLTDIMGIQRTLNAKVQKIDLMDNYIIVEPMEN